MDSVSAPMELAAIQQRMHNLGFELLERTHPDSPGYSGLIVAIRPHPTLQHFDPEAIHLLLADSGGNVSQTDLHLSSHLEGPGRIVLGRLVVNDRVDKRLGFFTFGACLTVHSATEGSYFVIQSSAPVLELSGSLREGVADQLAAETEALLARLHVQWGRRDGEFVQRLAQIDPLTFYIAAIHSILTMFAGSIALRNGSHALNSRLREEQRWLQQTGRWPAHPPTLDLLLVPTAPN